MATLAIERNHFKNQQRKIFMKNERILSYGMSQKLNEEELQDVSASGTTQGTAEATYGPTGADAKADLVIDG